MGDKPNMFYSDEEGSLYSKNCYRIFGKGKN